MQNTEQRSTTFWGNPLHFRVSGDSDPEGETVVFLNAGALGGELQPFEAIFGRQVRTIGIDLPGYASSGPVPPSYSPDYLADAALVVLDELGIQRATFVGAFWTASVAYRLAQKYPERVTRLAVGGLSATSSRSRLAWLEECVAALDARHLTQFAAELEGVFVADDESEERDLAARVRERVANLNDLERRRWECNAQRAIAYPDIDTRVRPRMPTLVFVGEHDSLTTPTEAFELARALPDAYFGLVRGAGPLAGTERFATVLDLLLRFVQGVTIEGVPGCATAAVCGPDDTRDAAA